MKFVPLSFSTIRHSCSNPADCKTKTKRLYKKIKQKYKIKKVCRLLGGFTTIRTVKNKPYIVVRYIKYILRFLHTNVYLCFRLGRKNDLASKPASGDNLQ